MEHVILECLHEHADARTRGRLRQIVHHLPAWGLDTVNFSTVHRAFRTWRAMERRVLRARKNSWSARRVRHEDTPLLAFVV